jgi:hypothetical protein
LTLPLQLIDPAKQSVQSVWAAAWGDHMEELTATMPAHSTRRFREKFFFMAQLWMNYFSGVAKGRILPDPDPEKRENKSQEGVTH